MDLSDQSVNGLSCHLVFNYLTKLSNNMRI